MTVLALMPHAITDGYSDVRWRGFGYLGARRERPEELARTTDGAVLSVANRHRWSYEDLFAAVLNSRGGRIWGEWALDRAASGAPAAAVAAELDHYMTTHPDDFPRPQHTNPVTPDEEEARALRRYELGRPLRDAAASASQRDLAHRRLDAALHGRQRRRLFGRIADRAARRRGAR